MVALALLIFGAVIVGYASIAGTLPPPDELQARASHFASTLIYDREGGLLNEVADPAHGRRTVVPLDRISPYLQDATIATEDPNFYQHAGVDPVGIAARRLLRGKGARISSPGRAAARSPNSWSSSPFFRPSARMARKVKEAILAAEITRRYTKDAILQIYLNEINYGNLAYGIEAAARNLFRQAGHRPDPGGSCLAGRASAGAGLLRSLYAAVGSQRRTLDR